MSDRIAAAFQPAKDSVLWAEEAVPEFKAIAGRYFEPGFAEIVTEDDAETGERVKKVRIKAALPHGLRRKATEALLNSRNAFDQAAFAARNLTSGVSRKTIYYPWSETPTDLEHLLKSRGIDQRLWDTFRSHKPYARADANVAREDVFRTLARIANEKHTVGLEIHGSIAGAVLPPVRGGRMQSLSIMNPRWDPIKNEIELARWIGDEIEVQDGYKFAFQIRLKDARLSEPVEVIAAMERFAAKAKVVIESLETRCREVLA